MNEHMRLISGILIMVIPTVWFGLLVMSTPLSFGTFGFMLTMSLLCVVIGANIAMNDGERRKRDGK